MGKIRVKVIGDEQQEQEEKEKAQEKREQKAMREGKKGTHVAGMKGGERTVSVGVSEEEIASQLDSAKSGVTQEVEEKKDKKKAKFRKVKVRSKRHQENLRLTSKEMMTLARATETLKKFKKSNVDETVELHINTREKGINGLIQLPHGTGKEVRVKVADDQVIDEIEKGKIDFDVLVATPQMMPKLARVAKILGPRGLMPNPKNGTITDKPETVQEKLKAGQISYKSEAQAPIIHMSVGKLSFENSKLEDNIKTVISSIGPTKISSVTLKSTMSPAVRLNLSGIK